MLPDITSKDQTETLANRRFEDLLDHAYNYYWLDDSLASDYEYDLLAKKVYEERDLITSPHKHLVDFESLKSGTGLSYISKASHLKRRNS